MADLKQYGVLVVGLLMAGGFAFGGMASYSSMIDSGGGGEDSQIEAELPEQNFIDGDYDLSVNERMYLTLREDVVFVSAVYNTSEQKKLLMELKNMTENFRGRAYISVENASTSTTASAYTIPEYPNVLVYGYMTSRQQTPAQAEEISEQSIASTICRTMNNWGDVRAYCASV